MAHLKQELEPARKRASELEVVDAQRADLLNEKDKELAAAREALVQRAELLNEKDKELAFVRQTLSVRILELERTLAQIDRK